MRVCPALGEDAMDILTTSPLHQLRGLVVTASEDEVVITGQVTSYYLKQLAQEALRSRIGQRRLLNLVVVCPN